MIISQEHFAMRKSLVLHLNNLSFFFELRKNLSQDFSHESLEWLSFIAYDDRLRKSDGSFAFLHCAVTGEKSITTPEGQWFVDGYCENNEIRYVWEYHGCR